MNLPDAKKLYYGNAERKNIKKMFCVNVFLLLVFCLACLVTPNDTLHIKKISFALLAVANIFVYLKFSYPFELLVFSVLMPLYFLLTTLANSVAVNVAFTAVLTSFFLLLIPIINYYKIDFFKILNICITVMAVITVISYLLGLFGIINLNSGRWLHNTENALIGSGAHLPFYYMVFMKASPLMLISMIYYLNKRKYVLAFFFLFALFCSGTRANVLVAVVVVALYLIFFQRDFKRQCVCAVVFAIFGIMLLIVLFDFIADMFARKESSDLVRDGHLQSILLLLQNPKYLLFGMGMQNSFYSVGVNDYVTIVELSYWNLLREVGLIGFALYMCFVLFPVKRILFSKEYTWLIPVYLGYLVIAYTNPFLYSSTGYIMYLLLYSVYYRIGKPELKECKKLYAKNNRAIVKL